MAKGQAIVRLTAETNDYERKMRQANKTFDGFMKGIGMSPAKFSKLGVAIAATTTALKVTKDAFMQNETNVDNWGRTVEATKSVYQGFLQALNTGDFSSFLNKIDQIINKAKEAYNAFDELQTRMTIINPERARLQLEQTKLKVTIRRKKGTPEAEQAQRELLALEPQLMRAYEKESDMNYDVFKSKVDQRLLEAGLKLSERTYNILMRSFADDDLYMAIKNGARGVANKRTVRTTGADYGTGGATITVTDTRNTNQKLLDLFGDEWRKENSQFLLSAYNAKNTAQGMLLRDSRYITSGGGKGGGRGGKGGGGGRGGDTEVIDYAADSIEAQEKLVQGLTEKWKKASAELRDGYNQELQKAQKKLEAMQNPVRKMTEGENAALAAAMHGANGMGNFAQVDNTPGQLDLKSPYQILTEAIENLRNLQLGSQTTEQWQGFDKAIEEATRKLEEFTGAVENPYGKTGRELQQALQPFNMLDQGLNQIIGGIEGLGIEIPKGIKDVMSGFQSIIGILSGIATILIAIEAFSALPFFSHGGVVRAAGGRVIHGRSYSGDNQLVRVNAGETILTQAQAGILASRINGMAEQGYQLDAVIEGEQIRLVMNRNSRRRMKGEYVTTKH